MLVRPVPRFAPVKRTRTTPTPVSRSMHIGLLARTGVTAELADGFW
jgi:hypothetical protein